MENNIEKWEELLRQLPQLYNASKDDIKAIEEFCRTEKEKSFREGAEATILHIRKEIGLFPMDLCNDGAYSDKEMIECLSGVIKGTGRRIEKIQWPPKTLKGKER